MTDTIIETSRLLLRKWVETDLQPFIQLNKDPEVMRYFPSTLNDAATKFMIERINRHFAEKGYGLFAVVSKSSNAFIGFTGFSTPSFESFFTPCPEIGWRYAKDAWGQGFATEAAAACLRYGFETLQLKKIVSFTSCTNERSEKVMQNIGMVHAGNFDHPAIDKTNSLCRHVLYEAYKPV